MPTKMQQQIIDSQYMSPNGRQSGRKLNREVGPLSIKSKNTSMNMKSKAFPVARRMSNAPTNMSPKAVSNPTSGRPGAGRSIGKKRYPAKRVVQNAPAQQSMTGPSPIKRTVATQPKPSGYKTSMSKRAPSYVSVKKSLRRTMGYNS